MKKSWEKVLICACIIFVSGNVSYPVNAFDLNSKHNETLYSVNRGDNLYQIGLAFQVDWREIAERNNIKSPYVIHQGQLLNIDNGNLLLSLLNENAIIEKQYSSLINTPVTFTYENTLYQADDIFTLADDLADAHYYEKYDAYLAAKMMRNEEYGQLYMQFVKNNNLYARLLGYDNYIDYADYEIYGRQISDSQIQQLYNNIYEYFSGIISYSNYEYYDVAQAVEPLELGESQDIVKYVKDKQTQLTPLFKDYVATLDDNTLTLDDLTLVSPNGYVTYEIEDDQFTNPNMVIYFNSDASLYALLTHEMGHYLFNSKRSSTISNDTYISHDISEIHSMSNVYFQMEYVDEWCKINNLSQYSDALKYYFALFGISGMASNLAVNKLERYAYQNEDLSPTELATYYLNQTKDTGYDSGYGPDYEMLAGMEWANETALLSAPLYAISYVIAGVHALDFWSQYLQNPAKTMKEYERLIEFDASGLTYFDFTKAFKTPSIIDSELYTRSASIIEKELNILSNTTFS